jgi:hypothetical protein
VNEKTRTVGHYSSIRRILHAAAIGTHAAEKVVSDGDRAR